MLYAKVLLALITPFIAGSYEYIETSITVDLTSLVTLFQATQLTVGPCVTSVRTWPIRAPVTLSPSVTTMRYVY